MTKRLKKILSYSLIVALATNFLLYSSISYAPPKSYSVSYSMVNCPTHEGAHHGQNVIQLFLGNGSKEGSAKDCLCYDCCSQRVHHDFLTQTIVIAIEKYSTRFEQVNESPFVEDSFKNIPIRSPPNLLS